MQLLWVLTSATAVAAAAVDITLNKRTTWVPDSTWGTDKLYYYGLFKLGLASLLDFGNQCKIWNAARRREWFTLSDTEKKNYLDAVLCLQSKPSQYGSGAPGAKSRYDDFVAVHIANTLTIHGTGNFLSWHRYFTWAYEQALRNECGYTGYQPYLNWGKVSSNPRGSPLFDGSDTSISGDGAYRLHNATAIPNEATPLIKLPPGQGGDCVTSGPFKDWKVNLGPVSPAINYAPVNPQANGLGYNPRCLRRDISSIAASTALNDKNTTDLISNKHNILDFQNTMQGDFPAGLIGVHTAGHFLVGSDPGGDLFASPGDPYFFLHHGQIDRTWWIWQNQDLKSRQKALAGTLTLFNTPPSRNTLLTDVLDLGVLAPNVTIEDVMSTMDGPLCYIYG